MKTYLATLAALLAACGAFLQSGAAASHVDGGLFRISISPGSSFDQIDPALSFTPGSWALLDTVCARLMTYPDKDAPRSFELVPEVSSRLPTPSNQFKTWTFTLRNDFRFSDGTRLHASAFAWAINRALMLGDASPAVWFMRDIVGADDVLRGNRSTATGVVARGNTLVVKFTRPAPDFAARTSLPFFCAVPPGLPVEREGVGEFDSAGPYYVADYRANERVVILQNRFYGGTRPRHVDGFDVDLRVPTDPDAVRRVDAGEADWGYAVAPVFVGLGMDRKHGINKTRFFLKPGLTLRMLVFNSSRPLFKKNPALRKAINFALNRTALEQATGGLTAFSATDQYLPYALGLKNTAIYPLDRTDLQRAKALARGNLRSGKAVLYTSGTAAPPVALAQLAREQLAAIGLDVTIEKLALHTGTVAYLNTLRNEPWDMALVLWTPNLPDPYAYLKLLLTTLTPFQSTEYDRAMRRAAALPSPSERRRALAALDAQLARDYAPAAPLNIVNEATFVSDRVDTGCITLRPALDLTTVCLKG